MRLGAGVVLNPPARLRGERAAADALPDVARRAWYWHANREAMADATDIVFAGRAVVMDRCFASTAAYGATEKGGVAALADVPGNVPRPDHVFFLLLEESERRRRLEGRGHVRTGEERRLSFDAEFRRRVLEGYLALGVRTVDASGPVAQVVDVIVGMVQSGGQTGTVVGAAESGPLSST